MRRNLPEDGSSPIQETENQHRLGYKLEDILRDPELALELGPVLTGIVLPSLASSGKITQRQETDLRNVCDGTIKSLLTPEQRESVEKEEEHDAWRDEQRRLKGLSPKRSPFDFRPSNS